ncbi:hypothetical protein D1007_13136 [Hordeum vulgare]|nr:hypothetical protein D1007_13136 [Hordeum vulgare]
MHSRIATNHRRRTRTFVVDAALRPRPTAGPPQRCPPARPRRPPRFSAAPEQEAAARRRCSDGPCGLRLVHSALRFGSSRWCSISGVTPSIQLDAPALATVGGAQMTNDTAVIAPTGVWHRARKPSWLTPRKRPPASAYGARVPHVTTATRH